MKVNKWKKASPSKENNQTLAKVEEQESVESATPTTQQGPSNGLQFSSREEAIQFGLSRLTPEEIAIYNEASKNGLTPEQEEMAIQMAYSRFTSEEIVAIKATLE